MSERRFSEEEVSEILKYAAEVQDSGTSLLAPGSGLTLGELQEIGRQAGISPEAMQVAARRVDMSVANPTRTFLGFPLGVGRTVELDRKLTDDEWDRLVADLRATFDARGVVKQEGSLRSWSNGNLQALLEPTATGQRLRLRTVRGGARQLMTIGVAMAGIGTVATIAAAVNGTIGSAQFLSSQITLALMGIGMFGIGAIPLPGWARVRRKQMDQIADHVGANMPDL
jgi:hypothetical protein